MNTPYDALIFELSRPGVDAWGVPESDRLKETPLGLSEGDLRKKTAGLPDVTEFDVVRHFTRLSTKNVGIDSTFYPLGSCTMKYNPRINEKTAALPGLGAIHPLQPDATVQGMIEVFYEMEKCLAEVSGMDEVTLQPAAGAHGELAALLVMKKYFDKRGEKRDVILIPDSAHGTNPASCTFAGFKTISLKSGADGLVDMNVLRAAVSPSVAGMMITNPNTLGLFETNIAEIAKILHDNGSLLYMDGANFNAIMGITRPGDFGVDVMHFNLHKTFSTPHGGGGPGCGPIGVKKHLAPFLPVPRPVKTASGFQWDYDRADTIGRMRQFAGNAATVVRALTYVLAHGGDGLKHVSEQAVLNANYLRVRLRDTFTCAQDRLCMHEFVLTARSFDEYGVHALDFAKGLLDYGIHPMTIYFPLIVPESMMIEPTDTESLKTLDGFVDVMKALAYKARTDAKALHAAPVTTPVTRLDEVRAAKQPVVRWTPGAK